MQKHTIGRCLFTLNALCVGGGGILADWNSTHLFNPRWRPHAKFHNGQTMAMGAVLAVASTFFTWRRSGDRKTNVLAASIFGGSYWWTQSAAGLFPGAAWTDPELLKGNETLSEFPQPQNYIDLVGTALVLVAAALSWPPK